MVVKKRILLFACFYIFSLFSALPARDNTELRAETKDTTAFSGDFKTAAVIDNKRIISEFSKKLDLNKKILTDYNRFIDSLAKRTDLSSAEKEKLFAKELDSIIAFYAAKIITPLSQAVNEVIQEKKIGLLLNKSTFNFKEAVLASEAARKDVVPASADEYFQKCDKYFNSSILTSTVEIQDLTEEVIKKLKADRRLQ